MDEYLLSPAAERDLENIWLYTRQQWSTEQADLYIEILTNAFRELAHTPRTAPCCDHIRKDYRRFNVVRHMIYFRVTDLGITIVRILHDRMDAPRYF